MINNFSIFKTKEKKTETSPDYTISSKVGDEFVNIGAGWIKEGKAGKYISCKLSEPYMARKGYTINELEAPLKPEQVPTFNRDSQGNDIKGYDKSTSVADDATIPDIW
jgi:uncharacterized protein (DUF736 family)